MRKVAVVIRDRATDEIYWSGVRVVYCRYGRYHIQVNNAAWTVELRDGVWTGYGEWTIDAFPRFIPANGWGGYM